MLPSSAPRVSGQVGRQHRRTWYSSSSALVGDSPPAPPPVHVRVTAENLVCWRRSAQAARSGVRVGEPHPRNSRQQLGG